MNFLHDPCSLRLIRLCGIVLLLSLRVTMGDDELARLIAQALTANPSVQAARQQVEQALASHQDALSFFDPQLTTVTGRASNTSSVPGVSSFSSVSSDTVGLQSGVELPVLPGFYFGVGAAESYLTDVSDWDENLYQTLFGISISIPLLRDRGFKQWHLTEMEALAEYNEAVALLLTTTQTLRHNVEQRYIAVLESASSFEVAQEATKRFQALLDESRELVRLKVIPQYQILAAQMELELRREEGLRARQQHGVNRVLLKELLGTESAPELQGDAALLVSWSSRVSLPVEYRVDDLLPRLGSHQQVLHQIEAAAALLGKARDDTKSDVSLNMAATWKGENDDGLFGDDLLSSDRHLGGEISLVWERPLGFRSERSKVRYYQALAAELQEDLREVRLQVSTDLEVAGIEFQTARERMALVSRAAEAARQTLEAEQERFRLGEGRSRYVLDAQKDLTQVLQRQTTVAAAMLRAYSDFLYAAGYAF